MTDVVDIGSQRAEEHAARSLALHLQRQLRDSARASARVLAPAGERRCRDCDEPIDIRRLACVPGADRCTSCGNRSERRGT